MARLPQVTGRERIAALGRAGFVVLRVKGSPHFLRHPDGRVTVVPVHAGDDRTRAPDERPARLRDDARASRRVPVTDKVWNEGLARDPQDRAFARDFLLAAVEEGVPIQQALGKVILAMGVKEFAEKVNMAPPNVLRAIHPRHNPTQQTLNRLLRLFKLRLTLAPIDKPVKPRAARSARR